MYIIKSFDKCYIFANPREETFLEVYSPYKATTFKTEKAATQWINENTDWKDYLVPIKRTDQLLEEFDSWVNGGMLHRSIKKVDKSGTHDYDESKHGLIDVLNFYINHEDNDGVSFESYQTWPELYSVSTHIWCVDGYMSRSGGSMHTARFVFRQGKSTFEDFKKEFDLVVTTNPTYVNDNGNHLFTVFDHYLHEGGNCVLLEEVDREKDEYVVLGRGTYPDMEGTLEECYQYLLKHRYYGDD